MAVLQQKGPAKLSDQAETFKRVSGIPVISGNMKEFLESAPSGVAENFLSFLGSLNEPTSLDYKLKVLLRVIVCMVLDHELGVKAWSRAALKMGWSRDQIIEAMYSVIPQVGCIPVIRMLPHVADDANE